MVARQNAKIYDGANIEPPERGKTMPVNLSIKNVPDEIAERLRARASLNHRSLQGELMAVLEESLGSEKRLTPRDLLAAVRRTGLTTPSEAEEMVRSDRDGR
jgi:plasmid stability protein